MRRTALFVSVAAVVMLLASATAHAGRVDRATGSGHFFDDVNGIRRTFAFTADGRDGGTGQAQIVRHDSGSRLHIAIDCLRVLDFGFGPGAIMSGFSTSASSDGLDGFYWVFGVVDGGEGRGSVDWFSPAFQVDPALNDCTNSGIGVAQITNGNVQVR